MFICKKTDLSYPMPPWIKLIHLLHLQAIIIPSDWSYYYSFVEVSWGEQHHSVLNKWWENLCKRAEFPPGTPPPGRRTLWWQHSSTSVSTTQAPRCAVSIQKKYEWLYIYVSLHNAVNVFGWVSSPIKVLCLSVSPSFSKLVNYFSSTSHWSISMKLYR